MESSDITYRITFQIIHKSEQVSDFLKQSLKEAYDEFYIEKNDTEIIDLISIKYLTSLKPNKFLTGFYIIIEGVESNNFETFLETFINTIKENEDVSSLIKLTDETRFLQYIELYKEIAHLEMQLREILTYIFYKEYPESPFSVLGDYPIKPLKEAPNDEDFKNRMENEFFYLLFSDYISLEKPKEISNIKDISNILENSESFESFKEKITKRGISNERHQDFLASLKSNLDTIEKVRNSVAHNRTISERAFGHYEAAKNKLNESFNEFWDNLSQDVQQAVEVVTAPNETATNTTTQNPIIRQSIKPNYSQFYSNKKGKHKGKGKNKNKR